MVQNLKKVLHFLEGLYFVIQVINYQNLIQLERNIAPDMNDEIQSNLENNTSSQIQIVKYPARSG